MTAPVFTGLIGIGILVAGALVEPTDLSYARQPIALNDVAGVAESVNFATFTPGAMSTWGTLTGFAIYSSAGSVQYTGTLAAPILAVAAQPLVFLPLAVTSSNGAAPFTGGATWTAPLIAWAPDPNRKVPFLPGSGIVRVGAPTPSVLLAVRNPGATTYDTIDLTSGLAAGDSIVSVQLIPQDTSITVTWCGWQGALVTSLSNGGGPGVTLGYTLLWTCASGAVGAAAVTQYIGVPDGTQPVPGMIVALQLQLQALMAEVEAGGGGSGGGGGGSNYNPAAVAITGGTIGGTDISAAVMTPSGSTDPALFGITAYRRGIVYLTERYNSSDVSGDLSQACYRAMVEINAAYTAGGSPATGYKYQLRLPHDQVTLGLGQGTPFPDMFCPFEVVGEGDERSLLQIANNIPLSAVGAGVFTVVGNYSHATDWAAAGGTQSRNAFTGWGMRDLSIGSSQTSPTQLLHIYVTTSYMRGGRFQNVVGNNIPGCLWALGVIPTGYIAKYPATFTGSYIKAEVHEVESYCRANNCGGSAIVTDGTASAFLYMATGPTSGGGTISDDLRFSGRIFHSYGHGVLLRGIQNGAVLGADIFDLFAEGSYGSTPNALFNGALVQLGISTDSGAINLARVAGRMTNPAPGQAAVALGMPSNAPSGQIFIDVDVNQTNNVGYDLDLSKFYGSAFVDIRSTPSTTSVANIATSANLSFAQIEMHGQALTFTGPQTMVKRGIKAFGGLADFPNPSNALRISVGATGDAEASPVTLTTTGSSGGGNLLGFDGSANNPLTAGVTNAGWTVGVAGYSGTSAFQVVNVTSTQVQISPAVPTTLAAGTVLTFLPNTGSFGQIMTRDDTGGLLSQVAEWDRRPGFGITFDTPRRLQPTSLSATGQDLTDAAFVLNKIAGASGGGSTAINPLALPGGWKVGSSYTALFASPPSSAAAVVNRRTAFPVSIPNAITIQSLSVYIAATTGSSANLRLTLCSDLGTGKPGLTVADTGSFNVASGTVAGAATGALPTPVTISTPGIYWLTVICDTAISLNCFSTTIVGIIQGMIGSNSPANALSDSAPSSGYYNTGLVGTPVTTFGACVQAVGLAIPLCCVNL